MIDKREKEWAAADTAAPGNPGSSRLRIRCGRLARSEREDAQAELDRREPDELFEPLANGGGGEFEPRVNANPPKSEQP